ncbi:uncharacterized protein N7473_001522 [Penicillium subrubescens]|uniref:ATPase AAA-type core domain-containing protein n=1 Tax=Penicillium subrubescens TaxID=1316194 RepID=A0A1Q5UMS4_9EURO|nr:uncharacterized protein N7473_001522 [Penicillium subrubescens]KAJ5912219.1 hypothetical protein N7473_001522 [Penicillium subrubescens]OKP13772.1 hypothetical protein PENSUB_503 [Penicillium subrubescens]
MVLERKPEFREILNEYLNTNELDAPYLFINHCRNDMENIRSRLAPEASKQLGPLLGYVIDKFGDEYQGDRKDSYRRGSRRDRQKPLYRVTCGDVGTKAEDVEKYLDSVLHLGRIWDCVVLLDEADVFLEQRSLEDLQRNALVSVFLRVLEYYEGILILTSNRVGTFDEAFISRIQHALHYPDLVPRQRRQIWQIFVERFENLDVDEDIDFANVRENLDVLKQEN